MSGHSGYTGCRGMDGGTSFDGSIQYILVDGNDRILTVASDRYHACITSYTITDENNDGIF